MDIEISLQSQKLYKAIHGDPLANVIDVVTGNASVKSVINGTNPSNVKVGREYIHNMYPDEVEYYACALELVDSLGISTFFSFPVMPESIEENKPTNSSIKKTQGGVIINNNATFKPFDISLSGDFGRRFRRLVKVDGSKSDFKLNQDSVGLSNNVFGNDGDGTNFYKSDGYFSTDYKTGYGNIKILEKIIEMSKGQDDNYMPYKLFFYNFSLNSHYLVEAQPFRIFQNKEKNMIWSYNLHFKAVAPASAFSLNGQAGLSSQLQKILSFNKLSSEMNSQASILKTIISGDPLTQSQVSAVENLFTKQVISRTAGDLNAGQKSAIQAITQLTANPDDSYNFLVNTVGSILTR